MSSIFSDICSSRAHIINALISSLCRKYAWIMPYVADTSLQFENTFFNYPTVWSSKLQICLIWSLVSTPYWHAVYHALLQVNIKKWALKVLSTLDDCAFLRIFVAIVIIPETRKKCIQAFDIVKILKLMNMHTFAFIYGCVLRQYVHWTGILH